VAQGLVISINRERSFIASHKFPLESNVLVHTHSPPHSATIIGVPTYSQPDLYTVKFQDGTIADNSVSCNLLEAAPSSCPTPITTTLPDWVKRGASATLFLNTMTKPRHGHLYTNDSGNWIFCPGNNHDISRRTPIGFDCQLSTSYGYWANFSRTYKIPSCISGSS